MGVKIINIIRIAFLRFEVDWKCLLAFTISFFFLPQSLRSYELLRLPFFAPDETPTGRFYFC